MHWFVFSLVLCIAGLARAEDFAANRAKVRALGKLVAAPAFVSAEGYNHEDGIRAIYFDALAYEGKPTKVFAWLGLPKKRAGKVPGIVLVHGGGGTAFRKWVEKWKEKGFAAIAIAHEGQVERREARRKWAKHNWPGPSRRGHYKDATKPLKDQWMFHAVADTILANSLLRSLPEVDPEKVGLMGVSWGGVITSTVMGIDARFAFAIPTYGCGDMADVDNHWGAALGANHFYREVWDPLHYLPQAKMPTLWFSWPGDRHFPLDSQAASYRAMRGEYTVSLLPDMQHSTAASWTPPDSYAFAECVVQDGKPWCRQISSHVNGPSLHVAFTSSKPLNSAVLVSTIDTGFTGSRTWVESPASLQRNDGRWLVTAELPPQTTAGFVNVKAGDVTASSEYVELKSGNRVTSARPENRLESHYPRFTWDRIPLYMHIRKAKSYTDEETAFLAKFPLITFEKANGHQDHRSVEAGTLKAARSVKEINPAAKILYYRNVMVHYGGYAANRGLAQIPGGLLKNKKGNTKLVRNRVEAYDLSNEELRMWWVNSCRSMTSDPHIDGIFLDGNIKALVPEYLARQIGAAKKKRTIDGYHLMMKQTREAIGPNKLMIANILRARFEDAGLEYLGYFDGSYVEAFFHNVGGTSYEEYVAKGIDAIQKAARQGKIIAFTSGFATRRNRSVLGIDEGHQNVGSPAQAREGLTYPLAIFLVCAEKHSYFRIHEGYSANGNNRWMRWFPEYDRPLGPPNGPATKDGFRYARSFRHATVQLDIQNRTASIQWRGRATDHERSTLPVKE